MLGLSPLGFSRVDHYMLRVRIKMRSSQYAAPRRDAGRGRGGRSSWGRSCIRGPDVLGLMRVQAVLKAWSAPRTSSTCSSPKKAFEAASSTSNRRGRTAEKSTAFLLPENPRRIPTASTASSSMCRFAELSCGRYYCGWSTLRGWLPTDTTTIDRRVSARFAGISPG